MHDVVITGSDRSFQACDSRATLWSQLATAAASSPSSRTSHAAARYGLGRIRASSARYLSIPERYYARAPLAAPLTSRRDDRGSRTPDQRPRRCASDRVASSTHLARQILISARAHGGALRRARPVATGWWRRWPDGRGLAAAMLGVRGPVNDFSGHLRLGRDLDPAARLRQSSRSARSTSRSRAGTTPTYASARFYEAYRDAGLLSDGRDDARRAVAALR